MFEIPPPLQSASVIGHEAAKACIMNAYKGGRMHHAWLITGPEGIGKNTLAVHMAHMLLSNGNNHFSHFSPAHPMARLVAAGAHPDLFVLSCPADEKTGVVKTEIPVSEARKVAPFLRMTASHNAGRVAIVEDAHKLNRNAQNALLKIIEEPSAGATIIMTATTSAALLPTIRSRCHNLALNPLAEAEVDTILMRMGAELPEDNEQKERLFDFANGSVGYALKLLEGEGLEFYDELLVLLGDLPAMNIERLHEVGGMLNKKTDQQSFEIVRDLLLTLLQRTIRAAAEGKNDSTGLLLRLGGRANLDNLLDLCEKVRMTLSSAQVANLDKKLAFIDAMTEIKHCAGSL